MSQIDRQSISELSLTRPATGGNETHETTGPLELANPTSAGSPQPVPLFEPRDPTNRPRILIVDDNEEVLGGMQNSLHQYTRALDVRFWLAGEAQTDLLGHLGQLASAPEPWRPQVVVLDIHMKGRTGLAYLEALRAEHGLATLAVVLATADHKRDLDANYLSEKPSAQATSEWLSQARAYEPEFVLYGKTGGANFLLRVGESASSWIQAARRRAWQKLLDAVAEHLDGTLEDDTQITNLGKRIAGYAHDELGVDEAFVRWRQDGEAYQLIAHSGTLDHVKVGTSTDPTETPLLNEVLTSPRTPVLKPHVERYMLGPYQGVTDYRFLGISATLDDRPYGFIALYRPPGKIEFDAEIDGKPLAILGRLLAAALGRATAIKVTQGRQRALLTFAQELTAKRSQNEVLDHLAGFLHREIHADDNKQAKVAIALINFRTGTLRCLDRTKGLAAKDCGLTVFVGGQGVCVKAIDERTPIRIDDVKDPVWNSIYIESTPGVRSELCVPLLIADAAIGVVNLEHTLARRYKRHDQDFVQSAANLAAQVLDNLRTGDFAESMLAFSEDYAKLPGPQAEVSLRDKLHGFCGYSALATLEPTDPGDLTQEWRLVGEVDMRLEGGNTTGLTQALTVHADWPGTWLAKLCRLNAWNDTPGASFTNDPEDFQAVTLCTQEGIPVGQKADAALWIRHQDHLPRQVLLLLWVYRPPIGANEIKALGRFATLFSSLQAQQDKLRSLRDQALLNEQAAAVGHVMQHFRHRLVNQTGAINGWVERLESDLERGRQDRARASLTRLKSAVQSTADAFGKAQGYVKRVEAQDCRLSDIVEASRQELQHKLKGIEWQTGQLPESLRCWTDPVIAGLILYSLLENAADALEGDPQARIALSAVANGDTLVLRFEDNGPGIRPANRAKLFSFGFTTKGKSLGSALAFARVRAAQMGATLRLAANQPKRGAAFELELPANERAYARITTDILNAQPT